MLDGTDRDVMIAEAASASLGHHGIVGVSSAAGIGWDGEEALRVTIVLAGQGEVSSGEEALNTISGIQRALQSVGDERFPFVDFTNERDLASDADPESDPPS